MQRTEDALASPVLYIPLKVRRFCDMFAWMLRAVAQEEVFRLRNDRPQNILFRQSRFQCCIGSTTHSRVKCPLVEVVNLITKNGLHLENYPANLPGEWRLNKNIVLVAIPLGIVCDNQPRSGK